MRAAHLELLEGSAALAVVSDAEFMQRWQSLHALSPHATVFQSPGFVLAWYRAYQSQWQAIVVQSRDAAGQLVALWLLARHTATQELVHAGAHQAEYHTWLALPGHGTAFLSSAWMAVRKRLGAVGLRFNYLPAPELVDTLQAVQAMRGFLQVRWVARPLLRLDPLAIRESFAKKSNKSRFNRLKKIGLLEFRRITRSDDLLQVWEQLEAYFDFRQGAVHHVSPFREDPLKRAFHHALFAGADTDSLVVTVAYLDAQPISAFWGMASGKVVHLVMHMYSPFLSEHSPGKLHLMQLSEHLCAEGIEVLDLTPGGDPWKERFASAHDTVAVATLFSTARQCTQAEVRKGLREWSKRALAPFGITPDRVRAALTLARSLGPAPLLRKARKHSGMEREFRMYRAGRSLFENYALDARVRRNALSDLLCFEPVEAGQTRAGFLSTALERLECGESAFTVCLQGHLAHSGWMVRPAQSVVGDVQLTLALPPGSVALVGFYSQPAFRGQGLFRATLGHMLRMALADADIQQAYIAVPADNRPARHVIESMGFAYQGSHLLPANDALPLRLPAVAHATV